MEVHHREQSPALIRTQASASADLGDMQVGLLRQLSALLKAAEEPAEHILPLDVSSDQVEASVREMRHQLRRAGLDTG